jgi:hypothetical protein
MPGQLPCVLVGMSSYSSCRVLGLLEHLPYHPFRQHEGPSFDIFLPFRSVNRQYKRLQAHHHHLSRRSLVTSYLQLLFSYLQLLAVLLRTLCPLLQCRNEGSYIYSSGRMYLMRFFMFMVKPKPLVSCLHTTVCWFFGLKTFWVQAKQSCNLLHTY